MTRFLVSRPVWTFYALIVNKDRSQSALDTRNGFWWLRWEIIHKDKFTQGKVEPNTRITLIMRWNSYADSMQEVTRNANTELNIITQNSAYLTVGQIQNEYNHFITIWCVDSEQESKQSHLQKETSSSTGNRLSICSGRRNSSVRSFGLFREFYEILEAICIIMAVRRDGAPHLGWVVDSPRTANSGDRWTQKLPI